MCLSCYYCKTQISSEYSLKGFMEYGKECLDGRKRTFHEECYKKYLEEHFVEEYKSSKIYKVGEVFIPYLGCPYYFYTIQECKVRIELTHLGFY